MADIQVGVTEEAPINPILAQVEKINKAKTSPQTTPVKTDVPEKGVTESTSTKTITKTSGVTVIDDPKAVTFGSAIDAINAGVQQAAVISAEAIKSQQAVGDISTEAAKVVTNAAANTQVIDLTRRNAELEAQLDTSEVFKAAGGADRLVKLAEGRRKAVDDQLAKQEAIRENVDVDFTSDPLQWLQNKFTIGALGEEERVATATVKFYDTAISNVTALANNADVAITNTAVTMNKATIAAQQELIAQQASLKAAEFKMNAEEANAEKLAIMMSFSDKQMSAQVDKYKLGLMARSEEQQQQDRELRRKALEKDTKFDDTLVAGTIAGRIKIGVPVYEGSEPTLIEKQKQEILTSHKLGGTQRDTINSEYELGVGAVSPTPFQTASAITLSDPTKFTDKSNKSLTALSDSINTVQAASTGPQTGGFKLTAENYPNLVNSQVKADFEGYEAEIKTGDETNPNKAAPLAILMGMESTRNLPLVTNVLAPLITEDTVDVDTEKVIEMAFQAVKRRNNPEGTISFEEAVNGISMIYGAAITHNNTSQNRETLGLPLQQAYNAKMTLANLNAPDFLGTKGLMVSGVSFREETDLTDSTEVRALGVKMLSGIGGEKLIGFKDIARTQEK